MDLSESQKIALQQIAELEEWMIKNLHLDKKDCWFTQHSIKGGNYRTLQALKLKGFLEERYRENGGGEYYRRIYDDRA